MATVLFMQNSLVIKNAESAPAEKALTKTSPFVARSGRDLVVQGNTFRTVGVNRYNLLTDGVDPNVG